MAGFPLKPKILVVDDQPAVLDTMLYLLKRAGCEVTGARTGAEALRLAQSRRFDLITLDIDLPDISGLALCRRLKQHGPGHPIPIILVSARLAENSREQCNELGADDCIVKPFDALSFVARIFAHLKTAA